MKALKIKRVSDKAILPRRATEGSAGMDLSACLEEPVTIAPGERVRIPTGIAIGLPSKETVGLVYARSGMAVRDGIALTNGVGVIDSDYTGEIQVGLINLSKEPYTINPGQRIAQLVVAPVLLPAIEEVEDLTETQRGSGGFGSTGR
ncbi:dUTP diphosphatase [Solibaculum mannosilyticum]|uniref:Deoxyuridine 5'-triphosphate nucleotidohydrolase n=1 Tax=Solibaculum mannosilyticum TaxID=2780922 RepID=A0A7I8D0C5_9FIRM|nr:dUTP diphosphatase [Solibaculum mannosilyticum]BCI59385.1 deoxyuridine 5'-triphosphate nucleotidohydrolase [Solibaculum mannosilyticum]